MAGPGRYGKLAREHLAALCRKAYTRSFWAKGFEALWG